MRTTFILPFLLAAASAPAFGQSMAPALAPPGAVTQELDFPAEREVIVREYVTREAPPTVIIQEGGTVRPGSFVPEYVELRRFGNLADPSLGRLAYFASPDQKIVLVDPETRRVVRILDR
jgi:hypothetical protein